jgi:hypothetical protein
MLRDDTNLSKKAIYIGYTLFAHATVNRIRPVALAEPGGWRPVSEAERRFPDEGTIFSVDPLVVGKDEGYVVLFTIAENPKYERAGHDRFITVEVCEPYEIIADFERLTPEEQRDTATLGGFKRGLQQLSQIVLPLGDGKCAFPHMRLQAESGRWTVSPEEDTSSIKLYSCDLRDTIALEGPSPVAGRFFALPGHRPSHPVGLVNWQSDAEFFDTIIKFIKRTDELHPGSDLNQISKAVMRRLRTAYVQAELLSGYPGQNEALHERLGPFIAKLEGGGEAIEKIASTLMSNVAIQRIIASFTKKEIEAARAKMEDQVRLEVRGRAEAEIDHLRSHQADLEASIELLEGEKIKVESQIGELAELRRDRLAEAQASFGEFFGRISEGASDLAKLLESARSLGVSIPSRSPFGEDNGMGDPPWTSEQAGSGTEISVTEFPSALVEASKKSGIGFPPMMKLDIVIRSGEIAILSGSAAEELLTVYASCLTAGAVYGMAIDPTILGVDDLWVHPTRRKETAFAAAWKAALRHPDRPHLVRLDDIDAASLSNWIPRLAAVLRRARPSNLFVVATRTAASADSTDRIAPDRGGIVIEANSSPSLVTAILSRGRADAAGRSVLKAPFLADISPDDRLSLVAGCAQSPNFGAEEASRLASMTAAAKSWLAVDSRSVEWPLGLFGLKTTVSLDQLDQGEAK